MNFPTDDSGRLVTGVKASISLGGPAPPRRGRGRAVSQPGKMNGLERKYVRHLELRKVAGELSAYFWDAVSLRLADRTLYLPDFLVFDADGFLELHEVKGHWEDDARVKFKTAAAMYPQFKFIAITSRKGVWHFEEGKV